MTLGSMTLVLLACTPVSQCPDIGEEGSSFQVKQLTGVWVIVFCFVLLSLVAKFVSGLIKSLSSMPRTYRKEQGLRRSD